MSDTSTLSHNTVGVIVAMTAELQALLHTLENPTEESRDGFLFHIGTIGARKVVAMQCGIGKVNAAMGAMALIANYSPAVIVNTGIAGGTGRGPGILDVVIADRVAYHDVWCGPGNERGQVQGCPSSFKCAVDAPFDLAAIKMREGVFTGLIASGDMFVDTPEELARILAIQPQAIAVDMESGAIAQVCALRGVPFLAVRVISDYPGAPDHISQYNNFWNDAPIATFSILSHLLNSGKPGHQSNNGCPLNVGMHPGAS